jgi:hypothetical protein
MTPQESLKAIRVSHAFCSWPSQASTGQVLKALGELYDRAYADGRAGQVEEGQKELGRVMTDMLGSWSDNTPLEMPGGEQEGQKPRSSVEILK